jgi:O-antigen ligase
MIESPHDTDKLARRVGTTGLYLFGCAAFPSSAASNVAFVLLVAAILLDHRRARSMLSKDPSALLLGLFAAYLIWALLWAWPAEARPSDLDGAGRLVKLWLFLPVAYWLEGDMARVQRFLLCVLAGFIARCIIATDWSAPPALLTGERLRCGISSVNHFGEYAATILLGLLVYVRTVWRSSQSLGAPPAWAARIGWTLMILVALYWVIASQSRGAILALPIAFLFATFVAAMRPGRRSGSAPLGVIVVAALLLLPVAWVVAQRSGDDAAMLAAIMSGQWSAIPYTPMGIRLHMLALGWTWWLEQPIFGQGAGAIEQLLGSAARELHAFKHLHNTLIDNLVRLGLVGTLILQALFVYVFVALWQEVRSGCLPFAFIAFAVGALALAFLFGQTDYRMGAWDWRHYWAIIGGVAYTAPLFHRSRAAPSRG